MGLTRVKPAPGAFPTQVWYDRDFTEYMGEEIGQPPTDTHNTKKTKLRQTWSWSIGG